MKCSELVAVLDTVAPTLADKGMLEIMTHFWFADGRVTTFDDHLAMEAPNGGLKDDNFTAPAAMRDLLKVSYQGGTVEFDFRKDEFDLYVNDNVATFKTLDVDDAHAMFKMPKLVSNAPVFGGLLGKAQMAIEVCLLAVSNDGNFPERCGITIIPEDGALALYAFNFHSIARCVLKEGTSNKGRITIPTQFWTIFLGLTKGMDSKQGKAGVQMLLHKDHALAQVGDVKLFAKTLPVPEPTDIGGIFDKYYTKEVERSLIPVTADLVECTDRAAVISTGDEGAHTTLKVKGNKLSLKTSANRGSVDDEIPFNHPDAGPLKVNPLLLASGLKLFGPGEKFPSTVAVTKQVVVLQKAERVYMVSGIG